MFADSQVLRLPSLKIKNVYVNIYIYGVIYEKYIPGISESTDILKVMKRLGMLLPWVFYRLGVFQQLRNPEESEVRAGILSLFALKTTSLFW